MSGKKHSLVQVIVSIGSSILVLAVAGWLFFNQKYVADQLSIWAYHMPNNVKTIENRVDFTDAGKFYFQATQPAIAEADAFNKGCPRQEIGSPILGCYSEGRIYIFDVQNEQLDGIKEVTAAHEMLHAVWERTDPTEQKRIGALLRMEYAKLADSELKERMDYYARTEPGELENELHSIIGTEVSTINPELETYYAKYFHKRETVLALHAKYDAVFTTLRAQSDALYNELVALGKSIEARSKQYNADVAQLSSDIEDFNSRADNGSFSSITQFNRERAALVARSNQLDSDRTSINSDIASYNVKYEAYNDLSDQIDILNKSIDSIGDLKPAPSL